MYYIASLYLLYYTIFWTLMYIKSNLQLCVICICIVILKITVVIIKISKNNVICIVSI